MALTGWYWPSACASASSVWGSLYVACQSDDDLPYVLKYTGEDNMLMGTDYGHHGHAADLDGLRSLKSAGGISEAFYHKIADANLRKVGSRG